MGQSTCFEGDDDDVDPEDILAWPCSGASSRTAARKRSREVDEHMMNSQHRILTDEIPFFKKSLIREALGFEF